MYIFILIISRFSAEIFHVHLPDDGRLVTGGRVCSYLIDQVTRGVGVGMGAGAGERTWTEKKRLACEPPRERAVARSQGARLARNRSRRTCVWFCFGYLPLQKSGSRLRALSRDCAFYNLRHIEMALAAAHLNESHCGGGDHDGLVLRASSPPLPSAPCPRHSHPRIQ